MFSFLRLNSDLQWPRHETLKKLCVSEAQFFSNDTALERRPYGPFPEENIKSMKTISIEA